MLLLHHALLPRQRLGRGLGSCGDERTFSLEHSVHRRFEIGRGGGSCAHGGRAYEARLNLILPAGNWWSRWVTLPYHLACKASALLVCHDPEMEFQMTNFE